MYNKIGLLIDGNLSNDEIKFLENCDPDNFVNVTLGDESFPQEIELREYTQDEIIKEVLSGQYVRVVTDVGHYITIPLYNGDYMISEGYWNGEKAYEFNI